MVQLSELDPNHPEEVVDQHDSEYETDDDDVQNESLMDRVLALADVVPPETRVKLSNAASSAWDLGTTAASYLGSGAWIFVTASFLLLLPVALEVEKESLFMQQQGQIEASM